VKAAAVFAVAGLAAACVAPADEPPPPAQPALAQPVTAPAPVAAPAAPSTFLYQGELTRGGWIRGQVPAGTDKAWLGEQELAFDAAGQFFAAFDRDAGPQATLSASLANGRRVDSPLTVSPRAWNIEHINASPTANVPTAEFTARRQPELQRIAAAKGRETGSEGWRQSFIWPATGRISGNFGSQRVYRGEPGSYHTGIDIAAGSGTTYVAPADGIVVLAADAPFTLEGNLLIVDHGMGLNSSFLHSSELLVREGDRVQQGQPLGKVGMTGRATGPHLHWGLTWRGRRLDPLLFTGPMP
jgi:murein DD-endopeptidase MepM/ murein hydrolase activator NlpD